jgi:hypothetical protein
MNIDLITEQITHLVNHTQSAEVSAVRSIKFGAYYEVKSHLFF